MKGLIVFSLSYSLASAQFETLEKLLPGKVTKTAANLEEGVAADFSPENKQFIEEQLEHLKAFRPALQAAEKADHIEIDNPVIGILKLPMYEELEQQIDYTPSYYIDSTHVKYLESAGARVVPIDLDMHPKELMNLMKRLNGVYIPGDHDVRGHPQYSRTVSEIIQHAQVFNEMENNHFPVVSFGYGALTMLQDTVKDRHFGHKLHEEQINKRFHLDYVKHPDDTFLFDAVKEADLVETFLRTVFYNTLDFGVSLRELRHKQEALKSYNPTLVVKESGDN